MTNKLTQAELIDLAKQAGFKETVWSNILGVNVESLAKFAQLIQQRQDSTMEELKDVRLDMDSNIASDGQQRNVVRKVEVGQSLGERKHQETSNIQSQGKFVLRLEGIDEYGPILGWNQHWTVFPVGTEFYTAPPTASQLVAQALEKAAQTCVDNLIGDSEPKYESTYNDGCNDCASAIRALIDQPVIKESLTTEATVKDSLTVEQGGDELVERFLSQDDQGVFVDFYMQCEDSDADGYTASKEDMRRLAELGVVRSLGFGRYEVTSFGDWLFQGIFKQKPSLPLKTVDEFNAEQALANRSGGE